VIRFSREAQQHVADLVHHFEDIERPEAARNLRKAISAAVDRIQHQHAGDTILRASLTAVAYFWNGYAVLHREEDRDFLAEPGLIKLRSILADGMDAMAQSVIHKTDLATIDPAALIDRSLLTHPRYGEYAQNAIARFDELQNFIAQLKNQP